MCSTVLLEVIAELEPSGRVWCWLQMSFNSLLGELTAHLQFPYLGVTSRRRKKGQKRREGKERDETDEINAPPPSKINSWLRRFICLFRCVR